PVRMAALGLHRAPRQPFPDRPPAAPRSESNDTSESDDRIERTTMVEHRPTGSVTGPSIVGEAFTTRPVIMGRHGVITAGHYLATEAGLRMFERGGNAVDAGVAAGLALSVLKPQDNGIGGEVPLLVYDPRPRRVVAISGMGTAPARATIAWFRAAGMAPPSTPGSPPWPRSARSRWPCARSSSGTRRRSVGSGRPRR